MTVICDKCTGVIRGDNFRLAKYDICTGCFIKIEKQVDSWIQGKVQVKVIPKEKIKSSKN